MRTTPLPEPETIPLLDRSNGTWQPPPPQTTFDDTHMDIPAVDTTAPRPLFSSSCPLINFEGRRLQAALLLFSLFFSSVYTVYARNEYVRIQRKDSVLKLYWVYGLFAGLLVFYPVILLCKELVRRFCSRNRCLPAGGAQGVDTNSDNKTMGYAPLMALMSLVIALCLYGLHNELRGRYLRKQSAPPFYLAFLATTASSTIIIEYTLAFLKCQDKTIFADRPTAIRLLSLLLSILTFCYSLVDYNLEDRPTPKVVLEIATLLASGFTCLFMNIGFFGPLLINSSTDRPPRDQGSWFPNCCCWKPSHTAPPTDGNGNTQGGPDDGVHSDDEQRWAEFHT